MKRAIDIAIAAKSDAKAYAYWISKRVHDNFAKHCQDKGVKASRLIVELMKQEVKRGKKK